MSSTHSPSNPRIVLLAVVALGLGGLSVGVGCADSAESALSKDRGLSPGQGPEDQPPTEFGSADGGGKSADYRGSPLCRITSYTCSPDDDGAQLRTKNTQECAVVSPAPALDAGSPIDGGGGASVEAKGCRLTPPSGSAASSVPEPKCGEANAEGTDGVACRNGSDCAPGFDCIDGDQGSVCRRYCCSGTCSGQSASNGSKTFCDVQPLRESTSNKAPVCMPIKACKLLTAGQCANNETCAVVDENGLLGCVANGPALANQPCDMEHCGPGLTCLGQPGSRKCFQLCKKGSSACGSTKQCVNTALFKDSNYGICM